MGDKADPDVTLDSVTLDELNSPEARALLDTIDILRELQVGEIVNLPQIIVVGDQSSGKSSVLEAISRVRFPTKGDLCTRFATELVLRRAPKTEISVRIDCAGSGISQPFHRTTFDKDALPEIINEATVKMGIVPGSKKGFSKDILRVEIADPCAYPVTLIDLPGFFHSTTADQTEDDKRIVRELAEHYMKQPKSIILAVVSANHNLANQIVAEEARKYDPNRERTFGVITKPDLAASGSQDEKKCLQLVRGQESTQKLKLGWHVLCNRPEGKENTSVEARDAAEEQFFQAGAWSHISQHSRGIAPLRKKLSRVLLEHIQKTLPGLIDEIDKNLSDRQRKLDQLGKSRSEPEDLRTYLLEIADKFQRLARDGVNGHYNDEFFGDLYDTERTRKLRAVLRRLNRAFHATMVTKGVDREIEWEDVDRFPFNDGGFKWIRAEEAPPEHLAPFLGLFSKFPDPPVVSEDNLREELEKLGASNQGTELPTLPNGELCSQLFKMQARPWSGIADFYLDQVVDFAESFVEQLFGHIIGTDMKTANNVIVTYVSTFFVDKRKVLKDKLEEILRPHSSAYGPPLDGEFYAALSSRTVGREAERIANLLEETFPSYFTEKGGKGLTHEQVKNAIENEEGARASEFGTDKVIDMAMTQYEMSLSTFTQNVVSLVVENCLISDISTILTPSMVIRMSGEMLTELASESEEVQVERDLLQHEAKILREGLKKCQKSRVHERKVLPRAFLSSPSSGGSRLLPSSPQPRQQESPTSKLGAAHSSSILSGPASSNGSGSSGAPPPTSIFANSNITTPTPLFKSISTATNSGSSTARPSTSLGPPTPNSNNGSLFKNSPAPNRSIFFREPSEPQKLFTV